MKLKIHHMPSPSQKQEVYDAHSHIGIDVFIKRHAEIFSYLETAKKLKIKKANIMPAPCPFYETQEGKIQALIWEREKRNFKYFRITEKEGRKTKIENPPNPYSEANNQLRSILSSLKNPNIDLRYIPLIHPLLDEQSHLEKLIEEDIVAIKIHGIAAGIEPSQVPRSVLELISKSGIPVILHTDNTQEDTNVPFNYLRKENSAINWINLFLRQEIKGYISHGAYLCEEAIREINNSDQFLLGIGPVKLIEFDKSNLLQPTEINNRGYLSKIFDQVDINKISFDIDFPCNVMDFTYSEEDLVSKDYVASYLSFSEQEKVFRKNAERFFEN